MWVNVGKFQGNGGSGYILKPEFLRVSKHWAPIDPKRSIAQTLMVTIISGNKLPKVSGSEGKKNKQT